MSWVFKTNGREGGERDSWVGGGGVEGGNGQLQADRHNYSHLDLIIRQLLHLQPTKIPH